MKKLLSLSLSLLLLFPLGGCESDSIRISGTFGTDDPEPPDTSITLPEDLPDVPPVDPPGIPPWTPPEITFLKEFSVTAGYDYGEFAAGMATMLFGGFLPFFDLPEGIGTPVAGDVYTMYYNGSDLSDKIEPGEEWTNGTVQSVTLQKAKVVRIVYSNYGDGEQFEIYHDNGDREIAKVASHPDYVISGTGGEGKIYPLSDVVYDQLYATYSPVDGYSEEEGYRFAAFYSGYPRYEQREPHSDTLQAVNQLNLNTNLPLKLAIPMSECDLTGYTGGKQWGCYIYEKDGCRYIFTPYPDYSSGGWYLTSVEGEKGKLTVFGLDGDETDKAIIQTMVRMGYKQLDWTDSAQAGDLIFLKNGVQITFAGKAKARTISIELFVSNDLGYVY